MSKTTKMFRTGKSWEKRLNHQHLPINHWLIMSMHPKKSAFLLKTHLLWIDPCPELKGPTLCLVSLLVTSHQTTTTAPETTETPNASDVHFAHLPNVLDPTPPVAPKKSIHPPKNQELQTNAGKKLGKFFSSQPQKTTFQTRDFHLVIPEPQKRKKNTVNTQRSSVEKR